MPHSSLALAQPHLTSCHDCGLTFPAPALAAGERAVCPRCGAELLERKSHGLDHTLALALTSLTLFLIANVNTLLTMKVGGRTQAGTVFSGVQELYAQGFWEIALLVFGVSILAPLLKLLCLSYVIAPLRLGFSLPWSTQIFRFYETLHPWAMTEVYMLGILVAVVKLADLASIEPGIAMYSFAALMLFMAATDASLDSHAVWENLYRHDLRNTARVINASSLAPPRTDIPAAIAQNPAYLLCHTCHLTSLSKQAHAHCPRCGSPLHYRKPDSLARTWALTLAAYILYIPANLLPVMTVTMSGRGEPDTILSGVKELALEGMWPLALLVFFASITVPVMKLLALTYLLLSVKLQSPWRPRERTVLYRITESVGRWSMIDIFVIAILVALVKLGALATIEAGGGAVAFGGVVVITMFAALSFDPRLIWDAAQDHPPRRQTLAAKRPHNKETLKPTRLEL